MPFSIPPVSLPDDTSLFHQGSKQAHLEVFSRETEADRLNGYVIYRGGVRAKYGVSTLSADILIVRNGQPNDPPVDIDIGGKSVSLRPMEAMALGKVDVVDPDGSLQATNLWFTWDNERRSHENETTGLADAVEIRVASTHIRAGRVKVSGVGFDFSDATFWTGNWRTPLFKFNSSSLFVYPGKKGVAKGVKLSFLGVQLPTLKEYTFSLDPRSDGVTFPTLGFRQDAGIGLQWVTSIPINDSSTFGAALTAYPSAQPTYTISYAKSFVPENEIALNQFTVTPQFGERIKNSFFESIYTPSLTMGYQRMKIRKNLFSVASRFNYETIGRNTDRSTNYSQPIEVGYENGGPLGAWAYLVQAKGSKVVEDGSKSAFRLSLSGNAFAPILNSGRLSAGTRFSANANLDSSSSGYFGVETGFSYEARNRLSVSAGMYGYHSFGTPLFDGDNFRTNQGYVIRGDWFGGSTGISMMWRYDPTQGWFDREYRLSQVVGPVEPVLVYRLSPRQYVFGLRFRTQDISKMLQGRKLRRNNELPDNNNQ